MQRHCRRLSRIFFSTVGVMLLALGFSNVANEAARDRTYREGLAGSDRGGGSAAVKVGEQEGYARLPLSFQANQGQTDRQVKFLSRGNGYTLFLTSTEAVLALSKPEGKPSAVRHRPTAKTEQPERTSGTVVRMKLIGANSASRITGLQELPGKVNSFIGNDPSKWRPNIPSYAKVRYQNVYPGVDLIYSGNQRQLEYDFVLAPGADSGAIKLAFEGVGELKKDAQGDLVVETVGGDLRLRQPIVNQEVGGVKQLIPSSYVLEDTHQVGFHVAAYDRSKPLVIDPVLAYSTYLGGSLGDTGFRIAADSAGSAYVTGTTPSTDFPTTLWAFDRSFNSGFNDVFVTKLNPAGSALVYSTYLGGSGADSGAGIAVDSAGNAYVAGITDSTNFPTTAGAFDRTYNGPIPPSQTGDIFVTKLSPTGSALVYSTYLGGSGFERANGIGVDSAGNAYVAGRTVSANFPTTAGAFQTLAPGGDPSNPQDAFVAKIDPSQSGIASLVYSTFLGGNRNDEGVGMAVDSAGNAYVTGFTGSTDFPTTAGAFQFAFGGPGNAAFVTKLNPAGSALVYSTHLGVGVTGIAVAADSAGNAYVTGQAGPNFPTTAGAFQTACTPLPAPSSSCSGDAFVAKIDPSQSGNASLVFSTFLGGSGFVEQGAGIAVDSAGNAYVTGTTSSTNFPTTPGAFQTTHGGGFVDAFLTKIDPAGSALVYSTYLGGSGTEDGRGIAVDSAGNAYVVGSTGSPNFPGPGGIAPKLGSGAKGAGNDAFVAKFSFNQPPVADAGLDQTGSAGADCQALVTLYGTGSSDPNGDSLTFAWTGSFGTAAGATPTVTLPLGTHTITLTVDDGNGETATDTVVVTVIDSTGPTINALTVSPGALWPQNHRMVPVAVTAAASDNCSGSVVCQIVSVSSNEPIDGLGDGDTAPDWEIIGALSVSLRAERSGTGSGRIYTITVQCTDAAGNSTTKTVTLTVPHDQAKK